VNDSRLSKGQLCVIINNQIMTHKATLLCLTLLTMSGFTLRAQQVLGDQRINVLFGLSQPLVAHGFNIEVNYVRGRFIADFSQGLDLRFEGNTLPAALQEQDVVVHMPWTTGFGIGYRFTDWINLRIEPKWHRFEFYYQNAQETASNEIVSYNTFTLGLGLYGCWLPFRHKAGFLRGIMVSPSVRYWPTIHSTLPGDNYTYFNQSTQSIQQIKTYGPGIKLSPWVVNISVGYSFEWKKRKQ